MNLYILLHLSFSFMYQVAMVKLFDWRVHRLGHSRAPLPLNFSKFKIPVRRSSWLSVLSFQTSSWRAQFKRSSAHLNFFLSKTRSFHFTGGLGYPRIYGANLRRFRYWRMPKYECWFLYYDYEDFVEPTLQWFHHKPTKDLFTHLFDNDIYCPRRIIFFNTPAKHPEKYPRESDPVPIANPPESITFKILNKCFPNSCTEILNCFMLVSMVLRKVIRRFLLNFILIKMRMLIHLFHGAYLWRMMLRSSLLVKLRAKNILARREKTK